MMEVKEMAAYDDTLGEIDLERVRYLLGADEIMEEMLAGAPELTTVDRASDGEAETICSTRIEVTIK